MQKAKLGVSVGLVGAAIYFSGLFNGLMLLVLLAAYVLLMEENEWLRRTSVKAVSLYLMFSVLSLFIGFIPDILGLINSFVSIFGGHFSIPVVPSIISFITTALALCKTVLFAILGLKALNQGTIVIPVVDNFVNKYM
ncbi:MAG: hypothetical protein UD936_02040 [Acutalibacteraceae bacterium]|nr:hypothetical protein [Acutalibacteraceae bacterium]